MRLLFGSPIGPLLAEYDAEGVRTLQVWEAAGDPPAPTRYEPSPEDELGNQLVRELAEYFAGKRRDFNLPLSPVGTPFQRSVWAALRSIPFGVTRTYRELAEAVDRPRGFRAVGRANGANPLLLLTPCHRVIATGGGLGGFGPGIDKKRWLLRHEGVAGW